MANDVKNVIDERIGYIESKILEANALYREYLSSGENATVISYLRLQDAINKFNRDEFHAGNFTRHGYDDEVISMYNSMKHHSMRACRKAVKVLDKKLAKVGIVPDDMVEFVDPQAEELNQKLNTYLEEIEKIVKSSKGLEFNDFIRINRKIDEYIFELKSKKMAELQITNLEQPDVVANKYTKEYRLAVEREVEKYVNRYIEINEEYLKYLEKGEKATINDYMAIDGKIVRCMLDLDYVSMAPNMAVQKLKKEGVEIAKYIKDDHYVLNKNYEINAQAHIDKFTQEYNEELKKIHDSEAIEYIEGKKNELIDAIKKLPMDAVSVNMIDAKLFVNVALNNLKLEQATKDATTDAKQKS